MNRILIALRFYRMYRGWGYSPLTALHNAWRKTRHA